jgi:hypothetical protein
MTDVSTELCNIPVIIRVFLFYRPALRWSLWVAGLSFLSKFVGFSFFLYDVSFYLISASSFFFLVNPSFLYTTLSIFELVSTQAMISRLKNECQNPALHMNHKTAYSRRLWNIETILLLLHRVPVLSTSSPLLKAQCMCWVVIAF